MVLRSGRFFFAFLFAVINSVSTDCYTGLTFGFSTVLAEELGRVDSERGSYLGGYSSERERSDSFQTPEGLRPRVDFWKDIFSRYGKYDLVVHHRKFPQAIFYVEQSEHIASSMNPTEQARYLEYQERALKRDVALVLKYLSRGGRPFTRFDQQIDTAMRIVPGGREKYEEAISEDLIRVQRGIKERHKEALERSGRYLPYIEDIFQREGVPIELTRLPFIESSFDYEATSSVGAAGIWQFMKGTARSYMTVSSLIDERRDPFISSRAAAKYLRDAYRRLGSWPLAITSYNHGVAGVSRKVSELGTRDIVKIVEHPTLRPFGFASTNFYPELLAAIEIYDDRHALFPNLREEAPLSVRVIQIPYSQSGPLLAKRLGVPLSSLASINLALSPAVWSGRAQVPRGYRVLIPSKVPETAVKLVSYEPPRNAAVNSKKQVKPKVGSYRGAPLKGNKSKNQVRKITATKGISSHANTTKGTVVTKTRKNSQSSLKK